MRTIVLFLLSLLVFHPPALGQSAVPTFTLDITQIEDLDGSGGLTCGDRLKYSAAVASTDNVSLEQTLVVIPLPTHALNAGDLLVTNANLLGGPVVILAGDEPGDSEIRVQLGRVCAPGSCPLPPFGAQLAFTVTLRNPNGLNHLTTQGTLSGANFSAALSDNPRTPAVGDATAAFYPPCPGGPSGGPIVTATKMDSLAFDADGDGLADPGDRVRYTVQTRNTGPVTAPGTRFLSNADPASRLVVGSVTTTQGTVLDGNDTGDTRVWVDLGTLGANLVTIRFDVEVLASVPAAINLLACQGSVTGQTFEAVLTDDPAFPGPADPTLTPLDFDADLALAKTDGGVSVAPGGIVAYQLAVTNVSTRTGATGVLLTETVPQHTTFESAGSSPGWICLPGPAAGSTCTLSVGSVAAGASTSRNFALRIGTPVPAGVTEIVNSASVALDAASGPDPNLANNSAADSTPLDPALTVPDLRVTKSDGEISVPPGAVIGYALSYSNTGLQGATGVVLAETVPTHTTFEPASSSPGWTCSPGPGAGSACTLPIGGLAGGGASGSALFSVRVAFPLPPGVTQVTNTVSIADDGTNGPDPTPANNSAADTTPIEGEVDLTLTKTLDPFSEIRPGGLLVFVLTYGNTGTITAQDVRLLETVPEASTFEPAASTPGWVCGGPGPGNPCQLAVGDLPPGSSDVAVFAARLANPFPAGLEGIENCAAVVDNPAPVEGAAQACLPVVVPQAVPDLALTKTDGGITAEAGNVVAYTLTYTNLGSQDATGVTLNETVPAHSTFASGSSSPGWVCPLGTGGGNLCFLSIGSLAGAGGAGTAVFAVTVADPIPPGIVQLTNQASIEDDGTNGTDPNPADNLATDLTPLAGGGGGGPAPSLSAFKSDALTEDGNGDGEAGAGDLLTYLVVIHNDGPGPALGAVFRSPVDPHTRLVAGSVSTTQGTVTLGNQQGDRTVQVDLGDLAAGQTVTITFDVRLVDPLPEALTEIACQGELTSGNAPPRPTDDPDTLEPDDPTMTPIVAGGGGNGGDVPEIPTLDLWGLVLLGTLLALAGLGIIGWLGPRGASKS